MSRVLAAERDARAAIEAARLQAAQVAEAARQRARALEERRRERVARAHALMQQRVQAELDALAEAARRLPAHDEPDAAARERLEAAVQALACALTTPDGASP
ncbi:MAG TPA: hypothetical protein VFQ16_04060 [Burkholderiaceae bacterium]|nr:hypothetical protein [Burkholderiaceae bacterium]